MTQVVDTVEQCVDRALAAVGNDIVLGAPLGLGKPVQLINAFYTRVASDPNLSLHIYTALSLELPTTGSDIEASLAEPIVERLFGDYEELLYMQALRAGALPDNITVSEFYFKAGSMKNVPSAQQNYISSNYTHVARDLCDQGVNVLVQLVATRDTGSGKEISLSCNTDTGLELSVLLRERAGHPVIAIAQGHPDLPFMGHDAIVGDDFFDVLVCNQAYDKQLFGVPNAAVPLTDYATAMHASSLVADGGTLQIGIGSLGDAVAQACVLRHKNNAAYTSLLSALTRQPTDLTEDCKPFSEGLYASTEMFVNGMMHLIEQGVISRRVYDNLIIQRGLNNGLISEQVDGRLFEYLCKQGMIGEALNAACVTQLQYWGIVGQDVTLADGELAVAGSIMPNRMDNSDVVAALLATSSGKLSNGICVHGGFFLGPRDFYRKLRDMDPGVREQIGMTGVNRTNQLLLDYELYSAQRQKARFINTGMMVTLTGAVASDALENGSVVSGVGGQYNFVSMAHDLPGARSILCIRATRGSNEHTKSNIVPFYGHLTVPKHLRDVIVTEYGVADLRGQSDAEIIKRLLNITDSRFQKELLEFAVKNGKLPADYQVPVSASNNTPQQLEHIIKPFQSQGLLPDYPFGTDLTNQEIALAASLRRIKTLSEEPTKFIAAAFKALLHHSDEAAAQPFLERVHLEHPGTTKEFLLQQLLLLDLEQRGLLKAG